MPRPPRLLDPQTVLPPPLAPTVCPTGHTQTLQPQPTASTASTMEVQRIPMAWEALQALGGLVLVGGLEQRVTTVLPTMAVMQAGLATHTGEISCCHLLYITLSLSMIQNEISFMILLINS